MAVCQGIYITIYLKAIKHLDADGIERVVIHELMHVLVNEIREGELHHEERVATQLQKAFSWVKGADKHAKNI